MLDSLEEAVKTLRRHVLVLKVVAENQPIGISRISEITGLKWHQVRYSLRVLEREGIIRPSREGAVLTEEAPELIDRLSKRLSEVVEEARELKEELESVSKGVC
ncbi:MAG: DUF977 family protein [Methanopyri archaeon]|nr:DUF977 family protein [Methanopyri archaeon]